MADVTFKDVIDHMHAMEQRLTRRLDLVDSQQAGLRIQLTQTEAKLSWQIDAVDKVLAASRIAESPK